MDINYALKLIAGLADGINPLTGEVLPKDSICNEPEIIRAFHCILNNTHAKNTSPKNAGKPWDDNEDTLLKKEFNQGTSIREIAQAHERTKGAISSRIKYLNLTR